MFFFVTLSKYIIISFLVSDEARMVKMSMGASWKSFLTCMHQPVRWDVADQDKPVVRRIRAQAGRRSPRQDLAGPVRHIRARCRRPVLRIQVQDVRT